MKADFSGIDYLSKKFVHDLIEELFSKGVEFSLVVNNKEPWDIPIEKQADVIKLDIMNWTFDESYVQEDGIYIVTAFGEEENSKFFHFDDVLQIIVTLPDQAPFIIFAKNMKMSRKGLNGELPPTEEVEKVIYSAKEKEKEKPEILHDPKIESTEAFKKSHSTMMAKIGPNFRKYKIKK